jgi:predicted nucleic acid-binding protein
MIAAHSLAMGTILVSSDRVFGRVKDLKLENWARP